MAEIKNIREFAKQLMLFNIAKGKIELKEEKMKNLDYLEYILSEEIRLRRENRISIARKEAKLPNLKWKIRKKNDGSRWQIEEMLKLQFISDEENIIITGTCQTGKTALASYICNKAIDNSYKVKYLIFDEFLDTCKCKDLSIRNKKHYSELLNSDVIVIDDFLYLNISDEDLIVLYKNLLYLNESRSLIIISNREMSKWVDAAKDTHTMLTLITRLKSNSHIIIL